MIEILIDFAIKNDWTGSMFDIVENDIKNNRFKSIEELITYLNS